MVRLLLSGGTRILNLRVAEAGSSFWSLWRFWNGNTRESFRPQFQFNFVVGPGSDLAFDPGLRNVQVRIQTREGIARYWESVLKISALNFSLGLLF